MSINFPNGFQITSNEPIDARLVMSKAEMLAAKKARMPSVYFTVCKEDGQMYLYNSTNTVDSETGRFRLLKTSTTINNDQETLNAIISKDEDNILVSASDGLKVSEYDSIEDKDINSLFPDENE